ncbi:MAG: hypothetical protein JW774_11110 [Candidatus Aureabacteria bacterium]|nr:hypothetical protein [Candidatus Auribacterota bacterium]
MKVKQKVKEILMKKKAPDERPLWKKILYPLIGIGLILMGIVGWIIPVIPGFPLIIIGVPLLFFFNRTYERKAKHLIKKIFSPFISLVRKKHKIH